MEKLKSCPFCGVVPKHANKDGDVNHWCDVLRNVILCSPEEWNTRAERTCEMAQSEPETTMKLGEGEWAVACSECGEKVYILPDSVVNFCISCGAKVVSVYGQ